MIISSDSIGPWLLQLPNVLEATVFKAKARFSRCHASPHLQANRFFSWAVMMCHGSLYVANWLLLWVVCRPSGSSCGCHWLRKLSLKSTAATKHWQADVASRVWAHLLELHATAYLCQVSLCSWSKDRSGQVIEGLSTLTGAPCYSCLLYTSPSPRD